MSVTCRIFQNGIATVVQKAVVVGQHLVLIPFFLQAWGPAYYGEWLTISAVPTAFALSDFGVGSAVGSAFVLHYAAGKRTAAANIMKTGYVLTTATCAVAAIIGMCGLALIYYIGAMRGLQISQSSGLASLGMLGASRLVAFYPSLNSAYFRAAGRNHLSIYLAAAFAAIRIICGIIVLSCAGTAVHYAAADLVVSVVEAIATHQLSALVIKGMPKGQFLTKNEQLIPLFRKSFAYMLSPIQQAISIQGTTMLVRMSLGPEAVALFNTMRTLCNSSHHVLSSINVSFFPELQLAIAERRDDAARKIYCAGLAAAAVLGALSSTFLAIVGPVIYRKWTLGAFPAHNFVWAVLLGSLLVRSLWWTAAMAFRAADKPEGLTLVSVTVACLGLLASWGLSWSHDLLGVALGLLFTELVMLFYVLPASCRLVKQPLRSLLQSIWLLHKNRLRAVVSRSSD